MLSKKATLYPIMGFLIGVGAPVGSLTIKVLWQAAQIGVVRSFVQEISVNAFFYVYMSVGTCLAFMIVGFFLGRKDDIILEEVGQKTEELRQTQKQLFDHIKQLEGRCTNCEQLKSLQDQIIQAEKLAAIGTFSSAVAHEINNPLMGIRNALRVLLSNSVDEKKKKQYLDLVEHSFGRIETTVKNLLGFARQEKFSRGEVDVNVVIQQSLMLCDPKLKKENILVKQQFAKPLPVVSGDAGLLQQVFLNVILNAVDAMGSGGKMLTVGTEAGNGQVKVFIEDKGHGISEEDSAKIFEPFFTTKAHGTGLGLSVCREIVRRHGGTIRVNSTAGQGTCVEISIPTASDNGDGGRG